VVKMRSGKLRFVRFHRLSERSSYVHRVVSPWPAVQMDPGSQWCADSVARTVLLCSRRVNVDRGTWDSCADVDDGFCVPLDV
jgi:hypothetical protein